MLAYYDESCIGAVETAFDLATHPERLKIWVINTDITYMRHSCLHGFKDSLTGSEIIQKYYKLKQIEEIFVNQPGYSAGLAAAIPNLKTNMKQTNDGINTVKYLLQIHCKTLFSRRWDTEMITEWKNLHNNKAILTTFPSQTIQMSQREFDRNNGATMNVVCGSMFLHGMIPTYVSPWEIKPPKGSHIPIEIPFWSHLFSFGLAEYAIEVPHDPHLKWIQGRYVGFYFILFFYFLGQKRFFFGLNLFCRQCVFLRISITHVKMCVSFEFDSHFFCRQFCLLWLFLNFGVMFV